MGIAEEHHRGLLAGYKLAEAVEVHGVSAVGTEAQGIGDYAASVALDDGAEGVVDGRLDYDSVAGARKEIDGEAEAFLEAGEEGDFVGADVPGVAPPEP